VANRRPEASCATARSEQPAAHRWAAASMWMTTSPSPDQEKGRRLIHAVMGTDVRAVPTYGLVLDVPGPRVPRCSTKPRPRCSGHSGKGSGLTTTSSASSETSRSSIRSSDPRSAGSRTRNFDGGSLFARPRPSGRLLTPRQSHVHRETRPATWSGLGAESFEGTLSGAWRSSLKCGDGRSSCAAAPAASARSSCRRPCRGTSASPGRSRCPW